MWGGDKGKGSVWLLSALHGVDIVQGIAEG